MDFFSTLFDKRTQYQLSEIDVDIKLNDYKQLYCFKDSTKDAGVVWGMGEWKG